MRLIDADVLKTLVPETEDVLSENCEECTLLTNRDVMMLIDKAPSVECVPKKEFNELAKEHELILSINAELESQRTAFAMKVNLLTMQKRKLSDERVYVISRIHGEIKELQKKGNLVDVLIADGMRRALDIITSVNGKEKTE